MKKEVLVSIADIEKLNAFDLNNVKGGVCSIAQITSTEDSERLDSNNNDTFNGSKDSGTKSGSTSMN